MALPDRNTNIMLDLETTSLAANPCIIEIGAVHFDFNTGREISHFSSIVSLSSCQKAGLHVSPDTLTWLGQNIPETLAQSERSDVELNEVLMNFAAWTTKCWGQTGGNLHLWGNGAFTDNRWIDSAFHAVNLQGLMPWKFYSHMCVRTFVKQVAALTGRDYAREAPWQEGRKHVAIDDCRHQVRYLVLARLAVAAVRREDMPQGGDKLPCEKEVVENGVGTLKDWLDIERKKKGAALSLGEAMSVQHEWKEALAKEAEEQNRKTEEKSGQAKEGDIPSDSDESSYSFETMDVPAIPQKITLASIRARTLQVEAEKTRKEEREWKEALAKKPEEQRKEIEEKNGQAEQDNIPSDSDESSYSFDMDSLAFPITLANLRARAQQVEESKKRKEERAQKKQLEEPPPWEEDSEGVVRITLKSLRKREQWLKEKEERGRKVFLKPSRSTAAAGASGLADAMVLGELSSALCSREWSLFEREEGGMLNPSVGDDEVQRLQLP